MDRETNETLVFFIFLMLAFFLAALAIKHFREMKSQYPEKPRLEKSIELGVSSYQLQPLFRGDD